MDFLNAQAQPAWNVLVLPVSVSYAVSNDGQNYSALVIVPNPQNPNPKMNPDISQVPFQTFQTSPGAVTQARYVRVHAESVLHMPSWHIQAGAAALLCTDQIVVY